MNGDGKKPGVAFWATVVVFMVLAGYPLSVGPVFSITDHEVLLGEEDAVDRFYEPLFWACSSPRANAWLWWYIRFWPGPYFAPFSESI
jgi:hypothetical protein